jgi:hypothetical protein
MGPRLHRRRRHPGLQRAAERLGLRKLDERLLKVLEAVRMLQLVACMSQAPDLPLLVEGMKPMLDAWRATPFDENLI